MFKDALTPLDYILNLPKDMRSGHLGDKEQEQTWSVANVFKNVVMRRLIEIRAAKAKPSLKDMIMESLKKKNEKDEKMRI